MRFTLPWACPWCGAKHDSKQYVGHVHESPKKGELGFCIDCGHFFVMEGSQPRLPTEAELKDIANDEELVRIRAMWRTMPKGWG